MARSSNGNGEKVTWRSLHEELREQAKERDAMEERLIEAFATGCKGIRDDMNRYITANDLRVKCVEQDVVNIRVSSNWWKGINGVIAAAITGFGLWLSNK